jgi:alcohol dehydrogenase
MMRAAMYDACQGAIEVRDCAMPLCPDDGVLLKVAATGVCRSDWHGWMGHDSDGALQN